MKSTYLTAAFVFALACAAFATLVVGYQAVSEAAPDVESADHALAIGAETGAPLWMA
ncbi:MAG: hypothetical protein IH609_13890 [Dehalococcoidia bacterium]|nr:hypothetical protein [Dehalococcoidia bacterium]